MSGFRCWRCSRVFATDHLRSGPEGSWLCPPCAARPRQVSRLAVASLICGVLGFIPPLGLIAVVLGVVAVHEIHGARSWLGGRRLALAGIITGTLGCTLVLTVIVVTGLHAYSPRRQMTNSTHLRGIHQGQVFFAEANNGWYAGFDRNGKLDTGHLFTGRPQATDWNGSDQSTPRAPAWRLRRLLENQYFGGEYCVSDSETKLLWAPGQPMDPTRFSYAFLKIEGDADSPRKRERQVTHNSDAVVLSDRAIGNGTGYRSIHTRAAPDTVDWKGSVCWNDGHVTFETSAVLWTQYDDCVNTNDNLFTDSNPSGRPNAEAAMPWQSAGDTDAELVE